jgi:hypothetical protein
LIVTCHAKRRLWVTKRHNLSDLRRWSQPERIHDAPNSLPEDLSQYRKVEVKQLWVLSEVPRLVA